MKAAFFGLGSIGKRHAANLAQICRSRQILLELHAVRTSHAALPPEIDALFTRQVADESLLDTEYDAVFVTNPTSEHFGTLARMHERSRCFFIEKPLFDSPRLDASGLGLRPYQVAYVAAPLRHTAVLRRMYALASENPVCSARAICSSYLPDWRPGVDYRTVYSAHKAKGGGVRIDLIHEWDYLSWMFGLPESVLSLSGTFSNLEIDSEDLAVYIARYRDKLVEIHLDYFGRTPRRSLELLTERETIIGDLIANRIVFTGSGQTLTFDETPNEKYLREMDHFVDLMLGFGENDNPPEHALAVIRLAYGDAS
jgi:predicted dehydrogenase